MRRVMVAGVVAAAVLVVPAPAEAAGGKHRPTAAVSLGDSYISGEAGRWRGNSPAATPGHDGTDRAYRHGTADPARIYGPSAANGCHRSDVAPIRSASLHVDRRINLACSGARTYNVLRAAAGGVAFKGEAPQNDQLLEVAKANRVRLITVSIGGNDLGFGSILTNCVVAYLFPGTPPCSTSQQPVVEQRLPLMKDAVAATLDDVRATMRAAGYADRDYRLILQSYPRPSTTAAGSRFGGDSSNARSLAGCPILDVDADWSAGLTSTLSEALKSTARSRGVQFLNLTEAFRGHELCASSTTAKKEWVRMIDLGGQGDSSESLHPNAYGQKAIGRCLTYAALVKRDVGCRATPHLGPWAVLPTRA